MRGRVALGLAVVALGASACRRISDADAAMDPTGQAGRIGYIAVGIYTPSVVWQRLVEGGAQTQVKETSARKVDDQAIIVVQNSRTGDIRACGDMTGYCVGMNPWAKPPGQLTPVSLTDHQPTEAEQAAAQKQANEADAKKQAALVAAMNRASARRHHQKG